MGKQKESSTRLARSAAALAILLVAATVSARASQLGDFLGRRVTSVQVEIEGAPGSGVTELQGLLDVAAGQDYSPVRIHDSLMRLHRSGLISSARVEASPVGPDGVALRFIVRPQARIDSAVFEGTTIFPPGELRSRLNQLDVGEKLSEGAVTRSVSDLQAFYSARGYYKAQITPQIRLDPTGTRAVVVYTIVPGEQARFSNYTLNVTGERLDLSKIKHAIVEGQPYMQSLVRDETARIRQLYLDNGFLAVRITNSVTPDPDANTVAVTINVESGPRVTVEIEGLEIDDKARREILPFYAQGGIDEFSLEEGRRRLQDYAQRKGYFFAEVTRPDPPDPSLPAVTLAYKVEPGRRYKLTDIDIHGVDAIPSETLQEQMKSKTASFIPLFGLGRGITSNDFLRQDANLILSRLREQGYRRATVEVLRGVSPTGDNLIVTFEVSQGPRTHIEDIGIRGNSVLTEEELRGRLTLKPEDPYVTSEISQNVDRVLTAYNQRGYATAEVFSELVDIGNINGQDRARLVFAITEGNRIKIRQVHTRGIAVTEEGRLERNFYLFKEGDYLRLDQLQETERVLYDTNAFSSVNITSEPVGETVNGIEQRDVTVNIVEARRYDLIYGFGYQTNRSNKTVPGLDVLNGARGLVQLTNTNMFGKLYTGSVQVRASQTELLGTVSFQNPRPFGNNYPTLISIFARRLAEKSFNSDRYTALIQVERRISPTTLAYLSYNFERISNYNLDVSPEEI
ncbi:MAG TPA: POTRA domain-containing protein, partial [Blastocatellia bacterium]|nr:POTRA domain-containing protein [Blastocatellia bacterium]